MLSTNALKKLEEALRQARDARVAIPVVRWVGALQIKGPKPSGTGVYVITDLKDRTVYVGSAKNLWRRYLNHCSRLGNLSSIEELKTRWIFRMVKQCATRAESYTLEKEILKRLKPRLTTNKNLFREKTYYVPTGKSRGRPRKGS